MVRDVQGFLWPHDRLTVTGQALLQHFFDAVHYPSFVTGNHLSLLFEEERDVRILLETVPNPVKVKVKALLLELFQARKRRGAVQIGTDTY
ncbi:hypothetical protein MOST_21530 [Moorella stamsii]|uniref:Uncharacterized protein n=1 Tax=Neomoorella stamsii TaxID=1266720 RepID=A0A9X7P5S3_9FIRM|nr:hypothetical protein MOST_21530 [Moorella stamsii]